MHVFGIPIDGWSVPKILAHVRESARVTWIVTANPEILLAARADHAYAHVLKQADICTVDGVGLYLWGLLCRKGWTRVTGVELSQALIEEAGRGKETRLALIGGREGVAQTAAERLRQKYPGLVVHAEEGGSVNRYGEDEEAGEEARHRLTLFDPHILLVGFGHPKQERWIARYSSEFPRLRVVMGVGGTFDYWAGRVRRAPAFLQASGLEWLWRLSQQPWRALRILRAVILFPVLACWDRLQSSE